MSYRGRPGAPSERRTLIPRMLGLALVGLCAALPAVGQQSANEQAVWKLESAYWNYVKAVDLDGYRTLWHRDFVGWPSSSAQPARKDHITDWITTLTERAPAAVVLGRAGCQSGHGEHRHHALLGHVVLGRQGGSWRAAGHGPHHAYMDQDR